MFYSMKLAKCMKLTGFRYLNVNLSSTAYCNSMKRSNRAYYTNASRFFIKKLYDEEYCSIKKKIKNNDANVVMENDTHVNRINNGVYISLEDEEIIPIQNNQFQLQYKYSLPLNAVSHKTSICSDPAVASNSGSKTNENMDTNSNSKDLDPCTNDKSSIKPLNYKGFICGFHGNTSNEKEIEIWNNLIKPVDVHLVVKINRYLTKNYPYINIQDLDSDMGVLAGTPPSRIYRAFIRMKIDYEEELNLYASNCIPPRKNPDSGGSNSNTPSEGIAPNITSDVEKKMIKSSLDMLTNGIVERTAIQIDLAYRQLQADRSVYLRNTDISKNHRLEFDKQLNSNMSDGFIPTVDSKHIHPVVLVLDNIRSAYNVGTIYRTAETAGIHHIVTCGITPSPPHPKVMKTALTSCENIPTTHYMNCMDAIRQLQIDGYTIISLETTSKSVNYHEMKYPKKVALVVGHEKTGVSHSIMEHSDHIIEIPTYGLKNSLNVVTATSIVLFEVLRQWNV